MSNTEELKKYLIDAKDGFLVTPHNNGKTIMLSGAWGSGKTHFWKEEIEREQSTILIEGNEKKKYEDKEYKKGLSYLLKDKKKACVYVSLYGKDNIESLKNEILIKAYSGLSEENTKQTKAIAVFGIGTKILSGISIFGVKIDAQDASDATKIHYEMQKIQEATDFLSDGGLICFDDFERKSKNIDLNDLFGFISQLAIDMNCKAVIILNSEVFQGEEKKIFSQVKEKTVSKYLSFDPEVEGLFKIIFKKYTTFNQHEEKIKEVFKEVGIVNARMYIQVLDNIEEWIVLNKSLVGDGDILRYFVLVNINFILTHHIVYVELIQVDKNAFKSMVNSFENKPTPTADYEDRISIKVKDSGLEYEKVDEYIREPHTYNENFIENLKQTIKDDQKSKPAKSGGYDNSEVLIEFIDNNQSFVKSLHFIYAFELDRYGHSHNKVEVEILNNINRFIETGILSIIQ